MYIYIYMYVFTTDRFFDIYIIYMYIYRIFIMEKKGLDI